MPEMYNGGIEIGPFQGEVLGDVNVRYGPSPSYDKAASYLPVGTIITVYKEENNWYKHNSGWSYADNGRIIKLTDKATGTEVKINQSTTKEDQEKEIEEVANGSRTLEQDLEIFSTGEAQTAMSKLKGIHGMPFHHLNNTDIFISNLTGGSEYDYGRKYTERSIQRSVFKFKEGDISYNCI